MTLEDLQEYMDFYEENLQLRQIFRQSLAIPFSSNKQISIDQDHQLFRIRKTENATVFDAFCLKSFRILEDQNTLFKSDSSGVKSYTSDVPNRAKALAPRIARFQKEHQNYMAEKAQMQTTQDHKSYNSSEPRFREKVVRKFTVELMLEHPYWGGKRVFEKDAQGFNETNPSIDDFLRSYEHDVAELRILASNLVFLMNS